MQIRLSDDNLNKHKKAFNILGYLFNCFVGDRHIDGSCYTIENVIKRLFEMHQEVDPQEVTIWQHWMFFVGNSNVHD